MESKFTTHKGKKVLKVFTKITQHTWKISNSKLSEMIRECELLDRHDRTVYGEEGDSRLYLVALYLMTKLNWESPLVFMKMADGFSIHGLKTNSVTLKWPLKPTLGC